MVLETFHILLKYSEHSGKFPDNLDNFPDNLAEMLEEPEVSSPTRNAPEVAIKM